MKQLIIQNPGIAGTLESSDISITVEQNEDRGIEIQLKSSVENLYVDQIKKVIRETLADLGVNNALVRATDKGALDCTIRARVTTAVSRATRTPCFPWEER